ncbi:MAG: tetratricopeptide repeat protein [Balneolaceae bacterium]
MRYLILAAILFIGSGELYAQTPVLIDDPDFQQTTRTAIDSLYNRNVSSARELMKPWSEEYPGHPFWLLWEAMEEWWLVLIDIHDQSRDDDLFEKMEKADRAAINLLRENPQHTDGYIIRAVANGYIARQHANRERWIRSIRAARTAQKSHARLGELAPDLSDNLFAEGLTKYYSAYLPEAYSVIRAVSWLLPSGDKEEGLKLLEQTSTEAVFARPEATYFLGNILLNYEKDYDQALIHFSHLVEEYPNNSFYRRLLVRTLYQLERDNRAAEEIRKALRYWTDHGFEDRNVLKEELLYWKGRILMQSGRHEEAYAVFTESFNTGNNLPAREKRSFHALSGYYAGITAEWSGDFTSAGDFYLAVTRLECEPEIRSRAEERLAEL